MADRPFDDLRRPLVPIAPRPEFAADLRRQLQREMGMTVTDNATETGQLGLVHLRVADADRAIRFFGELLGWEAERVPFETHMSYYTLNTGVTVRLLDDPSSPAVVPNYQVDDVVGTIQAVEEAGGVVTSSEVYADGGGWARGDDNQGVPFLFYRPGQYAGKHTATPAGGEVGLVFIRADATLAQQFYGRLFGWRLEAGHPGSSYYDTVPRVGVFDEAAAFGQPIEPSVTFYVSVDALAPALAQVEALGGAAGPAAQDMGPYYTAMCTDDQGTPFGLMAERLAEE